MKELRKNFALFVLGLMSAAIAQGRELVFPAEQIWNEWRTPAGTVVLTDGAIRPAYIRGERDSVNAVANAAEFAAEQDTRGTPTRFGGIYVPEWVPVPPSNQRELALIIDGDPSTGWAPLEDDPLSRWWVLIDLGRAVRATKVRLVFSEDAKPFEMFELYKSTGQQAFSKKSGVLDFRTVHRTTRPNSDRIVAYDLDEQLVRYFYLQATAKTEGAKLSEFEVFTLGDNIALGTRARGGLAGSISTKRGLSEKTAVWEMVDGDYLSFYNLNTPAYNDWFLWQSKGWFHLDLGNLYWVNLMRIVQQIDLYGTSFHALRSYVLYVSDGSAASPGSGGILGPSLSPLVGDLVWQEVGNLPMNPPAGETQQKFLFEESIRPQPVRHIFLSHRNRFGDSGIGMIANIGEFQVFGRGYLPEIVLTSDFLDLGSIRNITGISWEGITPPETLIRFRSRTGEEFRWEVTYWKKLGTNVRKNELTKDEWLALSASRRGAVDSTVVLEGWSPWSQPYLTAGETFVSPSPRKFVQLEVRLITTNPDARASLQGVRLIHHDPVAATLTGEIDPKQAMPGVEEIFTYSIRPEITTGDQAFDDILLLTPSPAVLLDVTIAGDSVGEALEILPSAGDSLWIRLPSALNRQAAQANPDLSVDLVFRTKVFTNGTLIESFVGSSSKPGLWQRVDPKNDKFENLTVLLPPTRQVIGDVSVIPGTLTPNGDGINDVTMIGFAVFQIDQPSPISAIIYDLSGQPVRRMSEPGESGIHQIAWDGSNDSGQTVLPGIYICRIELDTDTGKKAAVRTVAVVY